jgi:hypothetical protein
MDRYAVDLLECGQARCARSGDGDLHIVIAQRGGEVADERADRITGVSRIRVREEQNAHAVSRR